MSDEELPAPVILGHPSERLVGRPGARSLRPRNGSLGGAYPTRGLLLEPGGDGPVFAGVPDDNRSVVLPGATVAVGGHRYAVSVKGIGARTPLYGASPFDSPDFPPRLQTDELWMGEAPYGAQGEIPVARGLEVTSLAKGCSLNGFFLCPLLEANAFPAGAERPYWYRRYWGERFQEQRLVPSNIRLYHQSDMTLGQHPEAVLTAFGVDTAEATEAFLGSYLSSGIAALTLLARSLQETASGLRGLDYADVWLDKDSLLARDGTIHFADLEGLVWRPVARDSLEIALRDQFDRGYYEFLFGADLLLRVAERRQGRSMGQGERRRALATRFLAALAGDSFTRCEENAAGLDLVVRTMIPAGETVLRLIDGGWSHTV